MTTVLVGEFPPIIGLGLQHVFAEEGCHVVRSGRPFASATIDDVRPDAVVVDLDDAGASSAAEQLVDRYPGLPVVQCSSSTPRLRVFPAYKFGKSYDAPLTVRRLIEAVSGP